jgi:hypothetical protein
MPLATGGRWVSGFQNELVGQQRFPSTFYFPVLILLADDSPREQVTHFSLTSLSLCNLSPLFWTLFSLQPCLDGYSRDFHRYNNWAAKMMRYSYWPILVYRRNFNESFREALDHYPIKIVFFQSGSANENVMSSVSTFRSPAIVVVEDKYTKGLAESFGLFTLRVDKKLSSHLAQAIEKHARTDPDEFRKKGFSDDELAPIDLVHKFPDKFTFGETHLKRFRFTNVRLFRPNEVIATFLRRQHPRQGSARTKPEQRLNTLLNSVTAIFGERLIDHLVIEAEDAPDEHLDKNIAGALAKYTAEKSAEAYEALLQEVKKHLDVYPGACDLAVCCPSINPRYAFETLARKIPSRVLRLVLRRTSADYLDYVYPEDDFRSRRDFLLYSALMMVLATENEYLANVLSLHCLASRRPVLRFPKLSSALYGRLRALRRGFDHSKPKPFLKQLMSFIEELEKEIPGEILSFIAKYRNLSTKIISDLPIEWLRLEGVPFVYHRPCSRLPMTPGNNLLVHYQSARTILRLTEEEFRHIAVLNALQPEDEIYQYPKILSKHLEEGGIEHQYEEVQTIKDFQSFLGTTRPFVLIHFGHGSYDRSQDRGFLHIGQEKTEIWELESLTVPPIIMLAACETAAIAETHNTPANAWLAQGARSVLATLFPVQVDLTLTLFARIIANLQASILGEDALRTWEMVVSKTLMLNRYLDYIYPYNEWRERKGLPRVPNEFPLEFTYRWNRLRGVSQTEAHRKYAEIVEGALAYFGAEFATSFRLFLEGHDAIPHTMFFTHLGSPETIHIIPGQAKKARTRLTSIEYWEKRPREDLRKT